MSRMLLDLLRTPVWSCPAFLLVWAGLAACRPGPQQGMPPVLFGPMVAGNGNAAPLVAPDDQPDQAMLARALCDVLGECPAEAEETEAGEEETGWDEEGPGDAGEGEEAGEEDAGAEAEEGERRITQELVDFDADGRNEVLVRLSYSDVAIWHVLARRGDEYVSIYEMTDNGSTSLLASQSASGRPLLVSEHDCCCQYELQVLALQGDTFEPLFSWGSACEEGCDSGYEAYLVFDDAKRLTSVQLPEGLCGADGTTDIDTATWQPRAP